MPVSLTIGLAHEGAVQAFSNERSLTGAHNHLS